MTFSAVNFICNIYLYILFIYYLYFRSPSINSTAPTLKTINSNTDHSKLVTKLVNIPAQKIQTATQRIAPNVTITNKSPPAKILNMPIQIANSSNMIQSEWCYFFYSNCNSYESLNEPLKILQNSLRSLNSQSCSPSDSKGPEWAFWSSRKIRKSSNTG